MVQSIMCVLVSPTSLNTLGILVLLLLLGERNYCHAGVLEIGVGVTVQSQYSFYFSIYGDIIPQGLTEAQPKAFK